MWTLVLWFVILPADVRALSSIPGFGSKAACESAGPSIAKAMLNGSDKAQVHFLCVRTDGGR